MCGLIAAFSKTKNVAPLIIDQYQDQIERGQRGFGIIAIRKNGFEVIRATDSAKTTIDLRLMKPAPIILFHHRMPTSTDNKMSQTHPIRVSHDELAFDWLVMHNGVIRNDYELKKNHEEKLGYVYTTKIKETYGTTQETTYWRFNDSEAFAIELVRHLEAKEKNIGSFGAAAFIAMSIHKKTQKPFAIYWGTNGSNPIEMSEMKNTLLVASDIENGTPFAPDIAYTLAVADFFKVGKNAEKPKILEIPIMFAKEPKKEPMGFHSQTLFPETKKGKKQDIKIFDENDDDVRAYNQSFGVYDPLQDAFDKMCDRVTDDMSEDLMTFFEAMAYEDPTDEDVENQVEIIRTRLFQARERARKTREHYTTGWGSKKDDTSLAPDDELLAADVDLLNRHF